MFDDNYNKINITGYKAGRSLLRIVYAKKDTEEFESKILPELLRLGDIELYRKKPRSYYITTLDQMNFLFKSTKLYIVS